MIFLVYIKYRKTSKYEYDIDFIFNDSCKKYDIYFVYVFYQLNLKLFVQSSKTKFFTLKWRSRNTKSKTN